MSGPDEPLPSALVCGGCGHLVEARGLPPFRCPNAGRDDGDHVLERRLDTRWVPFPKSAPSPEERAQPFLRFRQLLGSRHRALAAGATDADFVDRVRALDARVAEVDGHGFRVTPLAEKPELGAAVGHRGRLLVKDETGNVAGSHKARHLFGVLLYLELLGGEKDRERPLAISSCGNAALAAAVVARAAGRRLQVYVPDWAHPEVLGRLRELEAEVTVCDRDPQVPGDPATAAFRRAVAEGAIPFSCQGSDQGLVVEGGMTLAYEVLSQVRRPPDRVFIQVGGGALASAWAQVADEAVRWGLWRDPPVLHAVQTEAVAPLARAWARVAARALRALDWRRDLPPTDGRPYALADAARWATVLSQRQDEPGVIEALEHAASHRSRYMWPWEGQPRGAASGILDDEAYDWLAVVRGMIASGGFPIVVGEPQITEAHEHARRHARSPVDATGSAGLAGLLAMTRGALAPAGEHALVLFTGRERS